MGYTQTSSEITDTFSDVVRVYLMIHGSERESGMDIYETIKFHMQDPDVGCENNKGCLGDVERTAKLGIDGKWIEYFSSLLKGAEEYDCTLWKMWCDGWGKLIDVYRNTAENLESCKTV